MTDTHAECSAARVFDPWLTAWVSGDVWATTHAGPHHWQQRQHRRLRTLVQQACAGSAWWRQRLGDVPARTASAGELLRALPVLSKRELMAHFDEAVTDRAVCRRAAAAYARSHGGAGGAYLGRYLVWESSGSSGEPALFVQDTRSLAVSDAIAALRGPAAQLAPTDAGARVALVGAIDGPFASILSLQRLRALNPWVAASTRAFSLLQPIDELVAQLNAWRPRVLATYPSMAWVLSQQQRRGAPQLSLRSVWTGGETLSPGWRRAITQAFGCPVRNSYGASECLEIASECGAGALHLQADWVILEPVDRQLRPVPEGKAGATTLLTNLANHVQPILRYDIGDRVRFVPGRCACGSTLPMIEVQGRSDDVLSFKDASDHDLYIAPLALATVLEDVAGVHDFRVEQRASAALSLELCGADGDSPARRQHAGDVLRRFLRQQGVAHPQVTVRHRDEAPARGASGKLARVVKAGGGRTSKRPQARRATPASCR